MSEGAEGRWAAAGRAVRLTSDPRSAAADPERSQAAFDGEQVAIDGDSLLLRRYDMVIRFDRAER